jgi:photosystem II stability/assembly factor-like uncharacterized protein
VSSNYGSTWTQKDSVRYWNDIAISDDGSLQVARVGDDIKLITGRAISGTTGSLYVSSDYGRTWSRSGRNRAWVKITMSSDGQYQTAIKFISVTAAPVSNLAIYVSSDYGRTWAMKNSVRMWMDVDMSSDGKFQTATSRNGHIFVSRDYG